MRFLLLEVSPFHDHAITIVVIIYYIYILLLGLSKQQIHSNNILKYRYTGVWNTHENICSLMWLRSYRVWLIGLTCTWTRRCVIQQCHTILLYWNVFSFQHFALLFSRSLSLGQLRLLIEGKARRAIQIIVDKRTKTTIEYWDVAGIIWSMMNSEYLGFLSTDAIRSSFLATFFFFLLNAPCYGRSVPFFLTESNADCGPSEFSLARYRAVSSAVAWSLILAWATVIWYGIVAFTALFLYMLHSVVWVVNQPCYHCR